MLFRALRGHHPVLHHRLSATRQAIPMRYFSHFPLWLAAQWGKIRFNRVLPVVRGYRLALPPLQAPVELIDADEFYGPGAAAAAPDSNERVFPSPTVRGSRPSIMTPKMAVSAVRISCSRSCLSSLLAARGSSLDPAALRSLTQLVFQSLDLPLAFSGSH